LAIADTASGVSAWSRQAIVGTNKLNQAFRIDHREHLGHSLDYGYRIVPLAKPQTVNNRFFPDGTGQVLFGFVLFPFHKVFEGFRAFIGSEVPPFSAM
jgi:hypothetical protein